MPTRSFQMAKLASGSDRLTKLASGLDSGGSVTVSAIKADIAVSGSKATQTDLPTVGSRVGELSYIVDNDNMYVWGGDGWFKMQIVNATPRFLAPLTAASYDLDSPGNPTVIQLYGADSDGFAPSFIHTAADSAQYLARIVQDSNRQFTITPLSADSINAQAGYDSSGGAFNVAFKVTDGRSEQLRNSSFSISYINTTTFTFDTSLSNVNSNYIANNKVEAVTSRNSSVISQQSGKLGKGYFEMKLISRTPNEFNRFYLLGVQVGSNTGGHTASTGAFIRGHFGYLWASGYPDGSSAYGVGSAFHIGQTLMVAYDTDAGTNGQVWFGKNGTWGRDPASQTGFPVGTDASSVGFRPAFTYYNDPGLTSTIQVEIISHTQGAQYTIPTGWALA